MEALVITLFGWPAILLSLALAAFGVWKRRPGFTTAGGVLSIPFAWYLGATPLFRVWGLLLPVTLLAAALAVRWRRYPLAWGLLLPFAGVAAWLAVTVLTQ